MSVLQMTMNMRPSRTPLPTFHSFSRKVNCHFRVHRAPTRPSQNITPFNTLARTRSSERDKNTGGGGAIDQTVQPNRNRILILASRGFTEGQQENERGP